MKKKLYFKTNTLLKNLVGKDLINDDNIAIVELVKNAYDANSDGVIVKFTNFTKKCESTGQSQLIIADEGCGMSLQEIEDKWLNIAYSEKSFVEQESGAYLAGNKGIGRFSCDRLGEYLDLLTRIKNGDLIHVRIAWKDFEIEGKKDLTIQKIPIAVQVISDEAASRISGIKPFPKHGTILVISKLRENWGNDSLKKLKTALEKFLNPNQLFLRNKFRIILSVPDIEEKEKGKKYPDKINVEVQNQIFEKLRFNSTYIESSVTPETIKVDLYHEGEKVFSLVEGNKSYSLINNAHTVIYFLNSYKKAYFKRQTGVRSVEFGSIFLFLNGFRVAPYGDRGDDWLGLDVRKAQGQQRYLGSRDIVGRIEVSGSEYEFKPISSREGLKETPSFVQLKKDFFFDLLRKLEKFVVEGLEWDSVPTQLRTQLRSSEGLDWNDTSEQYTESWERKKQRIVLSLMTLIGTSPERIQSFWFNPNLLEDVYESRQEEVKTLIANIEGIEPEKVDAGLKKHLSKFRALIEQKEEEAKLAKEKAAELRVTVAKQDEKISKLKGVSETYRAQTLFMQQASSLDVRQLMTFHHQINLDSTIADNYIGKAIKALRKIPKSKSIIDNLQKATLANKRIAATAQFATKANFRSGIKKELTDIPSFVEQYLLYVAKDFSAVSLNLEVENSVRESFKIKASRVELSILIDNIISNADKAFAKKMRVNISMISENTLRISFIDNGKGMSPDLPDTESMFEMGVTTTIGGSGLGLFHAKTIISKISGKISAIPLDDPTGMEIRIEVTK